MFVATYMSKSVKTVTSDVLLPVVEELLAKRTFRHLPVVNSSRQLVGIVTDRDLRSALPATLMNEREKEEYCKRFAVTSVVSIMTEAVARLHSAATLDDALLMFDRSKVGALPVVDEEDRVVGILSIRDLLTAYRKLFGLGERGSSLVAVKDDGKSGAMSRLVRVLDEKNISFTRLIKTSCNEEDEGENLFYVRVHTHNLSSVYPALEKAGFRRVTPIFHYQST